MLNHLPFQQRTRQKQILIRSQMVECWPPLALLQIRKIIKQLLLQPRLILKLKLGYQMSQLRVYLEIQLPRLVLTHLLILLHQLSLLLLKICLVTNLLQLILLLMARFPQTRNLKNLIRVFQKQHLGITQQL